MSAAVVIGAGGGIGAALVERLVVRGGFGTVHALSRSASAFDRPGVRTGLIDVSDEASIAAAASTIAGPALVIVATGLLHADGLAPERTMRQLDGDALLRLFAINTVGPALVAKHFLPRMPRVGRWRFAALSALVGSIGDNRLGGWHGYRASKAALNMMLKNLAIEAATRNRDAVIVGLHPGTVDTRLSKPFQRHVAEGKLFTPGRSAGYLLDVLDRLQPEDSGGVFDWKGERVVP